MRAAAAFLAAAAAQQRLHWGARKAAAASLGGSVERHGIGDHFGSSGKILPRWEGSHWTSCGAYERQKRAEGGRRDPTLRSQGVRKSERARNLSRKPNSMSRLTTVE